jgi:hypothetical protein
VGDYVLELGVKPGNGCPSRLVAFFSLIVNVIRLVQLAISELLRSCRAALLPWIERGCIAQGLAKMARARVS